MQTYLGPEHLEHLPKHRVIQNGDPRDNKNLPTARGVGHIHRLQRRILPHTYSQSVQEVHAFSPPGPVAEPTEKVTFTACTTGLSGPVGYVPDRIANGHRETSSPRLVTYETHPVAPQKQLASSGITGKGHSYTQDPTPSSTMVARRKQCAPKVNHYTQ